MNILPTPDYIVEFAIFDEDDEISSTRIMLGHPQTLIQNKWISNECSMWVIDFTPDLSIKHPKIDLGVIGEWDPYEPDEISNIHIISTPSVISVLYGNNSGLWHVDVTGFRTLLSSITQHQYNISTITW